VVETGGLRVFPRLVAAEHRDRYERSTVPSGVEEVDALLGGGLEDGSSTLLIGPAGVGKSVLIAQYALAAAQRGESSAIYIFDESASMFLQRSKGLGIELAPYVASGLVVLRQLDTGEVTPGQFDELVRESVESGARLIAIDSLNGYLNAMSEEHLVLLKLHELLSFLGAQRVLTLMTVAQHGTIGDRMETPLDVSYLADSVILLRYFEAEGELRQAISVVKKRMGSHERTIRQFSLAPGTIRVGEPLREFRGVLSGTPQYVGQSGILISGPETAAES
jgi:circadian clock protein KaiC